MAEDSKMQLVGWGRSVGIDLGQAGEFTALVVDEWGVIQEPGAPKHKVAFAHDITFLHRFPKGTSIPEVVRAARKVIEQLPRSPAPSLYVGVNGLGVRVLEMMRHEDLIPVGVTLTNGADIVQPVPNDVRIGKRELAGLIQVGLQTERLKIAADLPLTPTLAKELETFKLKVNLAAPADFESAREGEHDDLVLAAGVAMWGAEWSEMRERNRGQFLFG